MKTESKKSSDNDCCDGKLVKVTGDQLSCTSSEGQSRHYTIAEKVEVTCDGKPSRLKDLRPGDAIRMTMCQDDPQQIVAIDCGEQVPELAND
jgi:hypothetical protein